MYKKIFVIGLFVSLTNISSVQCMEDPNKGFMAALPVIKQVAQYMDKKVIDPIIITTCSTAGAAFGTYIVKDSFSKYYGNSYTFKPEQRFEDDLGMYVGTAIGFSIGKHMVDLRHMITDPLFYHGSQFILTFIDTSSSFSKKKASDFGTYIANKIHSGEARLRAIGDKYKQQ